MSLKYEPASEPQIVNEKSVKIIRKVAIQTKTVRINKNVKGRRRWGKFGDCDGQAPGHKEAGNAKPQPP